MGRERNALLARKSTKEYGLAVVRRRRPHTIRTFDDALARSGDFFWRYPECGNVNAKMLAPSDQTIFRLIKGNVSDLAAADPAFVAVLKKAVIDVVGRHRESAP